MIMLSSSNKKISVFQKIIAFLLLGILIFMSLIWYSDFSLNNGYSPLQIPTVRSCQIDADCQWFAASCVNKDFKMPEQRILSSAFPVWEYNDNPCVCKNYLITNLCEIK